MSALNMSLYYVFTHSFELWPDAYECPESLESLELTRPVLGAYFLITGVIFVTLYILCLIAILRLKGRAPAFQLMLILSIFDIQALLVNSIATGIFNILGISYCQFPLFIFIIGAIGGGSWMSGCLASVLLAIERCAEVNPNFSLEFLFRKRVFPVVMVLVIVYGIYSTGFVKPVLFTVEYSCWFFDPQIGNDPNLYNSLPDTINNIAVAISSTTLYFYLCYHLLFKYGYSTSMWLYKTKRQIILQGVILCMFHAIDAALYEYMKFFYSSPVLILLSQFMWQWSSGCMCIAYLTLNRTIRNSVMRMVLPKEFRKRNRLHVGFDEHLEQTKTVNAVGLSTINTLIYLPCFIVMIRSKRRAPSYQLMIILGVFDLISLLVNSIITGILGIMGASFCTYPMFIFVTGAIGMGSWMGACVCCILMAMDRCVEINSHFPLAFLFHKFVFRFVMLAIVSYWIFGWFTTKPVLFLAQHMCWFFDPNIGNDPNLYHNYPHTVNNMSVAVISTPLYMYLCYHLIFKFGYSTSMWMYKTKHQIVFQAIILCSFHAAAAYIYTYMQFFPSPEWLIIVGQLAWQWSNGCVCLAYWTLNRTIRNSAIRMMFSREFRRNYKLHLGIDEQIAAERGEEIRSVTTNIDVYTGNNNNNNTHTAKVAPFLE
ncbi:hypothetical protein CAEBREN_23967 [Caenorhabditis brenneri]|uniref:Serpentine Receptor, class T n=1 Tax=Caenorhabditis brenneri TaxID=135651 RepID=G0PHF9_CAEBE|nr:hypothetical protein CAEBREN_23967 [Caenorhabditis brenneri]